MTRTSILVTAPILATALVTSIACQIDDDTADAEFRGADPDEDVDAEIGPAVPTSTYYIVTAIDTRKCMFPICGGVFVQEVNNKETRCADGSYAESCHVAVTDYAALGLPANLEQKVDAAWVSEQALLRGTLFQAGGPYDPFRVDTLAASEAWVGVTGNVPEGTFERLDDSGIVCVTFPCESFIERILNDTVARYIAEVDLAASGATQAQIDAGYTELFESGLLAAGEATVVYGPAGSAPGFAASEFYQRVIADVGEPCGATTCDAGLVCCNPSCGVCTGPDEQCLDVVCPPLE